MGIYDLDLQELPLFEGLKADEVDQFIQATGAKVKRYGKEMRMFVRRAKKAMALPMPVARPAPRVSSSGTSMFVSMCFFRVWSDLRAARPKAAPYNNNLCSMASAPLLPGAKIVLPAEKNDPGESVFLMVPSAPPVVGRRKIFPSKGLHAPRKCLTFVHNYSETRIL